MLDEDFINKSLLASLDAQADAEPDDSDHPSSSSGSPSVTYPVHRPESPPGYHYDGGFATNRNSFNSYPNTTRPRHQLFYQPPDTSYLPYDPRQSYDFTNTQAKSYHIDQFGQHLKQQQQPQQQQFTSSSSQFSNGVSQTPYGPHVPTSVPMAPSTSTGGPPGLPPPANTATTTVGGEEISTIFVVGFPEDMQEREFQNMFTFSPGFEAATLKIPNKEYTAYGGLVGAAPGAPLANGLRAPAFPSYPGQNDPYNLVTVNQGGVVVDGSRDGSMPSYPLQDDLSSNQHFLSSTGLGGMNGLAAAAAAANAAAAAAANIPPRKQIIGFAKFRSRDEALIARDVLQGRRVDIEKGAVLKAEMAKKNLHTKRGVGPVPGMGVAGGGPGPTAPPGPGPPGVPGPQQQNTPQQPPPQPTHMNGLDSFGSGAEFQAREHRDSANLSGLSRLGWRDSIGLQQQLTELPNGSTASLNGLVNGTPARAEDDERKRDSLPPSATPTLRGPRERVAEDERRKDMEREKEMNLMRLRASNSKAFDAFHSVSINTNTTTAVSSPSSALSPSSSMGLLAISRQTSNGSTNGNGTLLTAPSSAQPTVAESIGSSPMISGAEPSLHLLQQQQNEDEIVVGPWDRINLPLPVGPPGAAGRARSETQGSMSPAPFKTQSESSQTSDVTGPPAGQNGSNPLGHIGSKAVGGEQPINGNGNGTTNGHGTSSGGSTGNASPTLPSPASGGSSGSVGSVSTTGANSLRGTVDQNPPINTLYVGNLPTSPPPMGYPADYLEETLRDVFQQRPGYRKLCFRQKAAGPMCFVEFDDVQYARKAMTEMSGHTLRGLVKNGIRLSFSKNPLGVRTPTSAGGSGGPTLQQQQQLMQTLNHHQHAQFQQQQQQQQQHLGGAGHDGFQTRLPDEFVSGGGAGPQQQQQQQQQQQAQQHHHHNHHHHHPHRGGGIQQTPTILRRDSTLSAQGLHHQSFSVGVAGNVVNNNNNNSQNPNTFMSSPPPRFYSTSPGGMSFASAASTPLTGASNAFIPRSAAANGGGMFGGGGGGHGHHHHNGAFASSPPASFTPFAAFGAAPPPPPPGDHAFGQMAHHQHLHQQQHSIPIEQQQQQVHPDE